MLRKIIATLALATSACATTTPQHLQEPDRSQFYVACIMHQVYVTTCECMEERAIEKTGVTNVSKLPPDQQTDFAKALAAEYEQCSRETQDSLKDQVLSPDNSQKPAELHFRRN